MGLRPHPSACRGGKQRQEQLTRDSHLGSEQEPTADARQAVPGPHRRRRRTRFGGGSQVRLGTFDHSPGEAPISSSSADMGPGHVPYPWSTDRLVRLDRRPHQRLVLARREHGRDVVRELPDRRLGLSETGSGICFDTADPVTLGRAQPESGHSSRRSVHSRSSILCLSGWTDSRCECVQRARRVTTR